MSGRRNLLDRVKARQEKAVERLEARSKRTDQQQLDLLMARGHAHCKEAAKLATKIVGKGECYTLPNGECITIKCDLHGA
jgi:hypothetical protein